MHFQRSRIAAVLAVGALVVGVVAIEASASDVRIATIISDDAGSAISGALCTNSGGCNGMQVALQCTYQARYKACEQLNPCDAGVNDFLVDAEPKTMDFRLKGSERFIAIHPNDGGPVTCRVYSVSPATLPQ